MIMSEVKSVEMPMEDSGDAELLCLCEELLDVIFDSVTDSAVAWEHLRDALNVLFRVLVISSHPNVQ